LFRNRQKTFTIGLSKGKSPAAMQSGPFSVSISIVAGLEKFSANPEREFEVIAREKDRTGQHRRVH
jgi:hypothetical protein